MQLCHLTRLTTSAISHPRHSCMWTFTTCSNLSTHLFLLHVVHHNCGSNTHCVLMAAATCLTSSTSEVKLWAMNLFFFISCNYRMVLVYTVLSWTPEPEMFHELQVKSSLLMVTCHTFVHIMLDADACWISKCLGVFTIHWFQDFVSILLCIFAYNWSPYSDCIYVLLRIHSRICSMVFGDNLKNTKTCYYETIEYYPKERFFVVLK
jgi:hypothetical protein